MTWLKGRTPEQKWAQAHPYGEQGTVDYWVEALKRAYELGEPRAQGEIDRLLALTGPQSPIRWLDLPRWFQDMWTDQLAPYNRGTHRLAMPY
jgi:hypothetical protein